MCFNLRGAAAALWRRKPVGLFRSLLGVAAGVVAASYLVSVARTAIGLLGGLSVDSLNTTLEIWFEFAVAALATAGTVGMIGSTVWNSVRVTQAAPTSSTANVSASPVQSASGASGLPSTTPTVGISAPRPSMPSVMHATVKPPVSRWFDGWNERSTWLTLSALGAVAAAGCAFHAGAQPGMRSADLSLRIIPFVAGANLVGGALYLAAEASATSFGSHFLRDWGSHTAAHAAFVASLMCGSIGSAVSMLGLRSLPASAQADLTSAVEVNVAVVGCVQMFVLLFSTLANNLTDAGRRLQDRPSWVAQRKDARLPRVKRFVDDIGHMWAVAAAAVVFTIALAASGATFVARPDLPTANGFVILIALEGVTIVAILLALMSVLQSHVKGYLQQLQTSIRGDLRPDLQMSLLTDFAFPVDIASFLLLLTTSSLCYVFQVAAAADAGLVLQAALAALQVVESSIQAMLVCMLHANGFVAIVQPMAGAEEGTEMVQEFTTFHRVAITWINGQVVSINAVWLAVLFIPSLPTVPGGSPVIATISFASVAVMRCHALFAWLSLPWRILCADNSAVVVSRNPMTATADSRLAVSDPARCSAAPAPDPGALRQGAVPLPPSDPPLDGSKSGQHPPSSTAGDSEHKAPHRGADARTWVAARASLTGAHTPFTHEADWHKRGSVGPTAGVGGDEAVSGGPAGLQDTFSNPMKGPSRGARVSKLSTSGGGAPAVDGGGAVAVMP